MSMWPDVVARVRGLSTHLLTAPQRSALARARDLDDLAAQLVRLGYVSSDMDATADPRRLEIALRRTAAASLRLLVRWSALRAPLLAPLFDDEDRRSIRALLRGAVAHAAPDDRVAGLIPTAVLPERALQELAHCADVAEVAALLSVWSHPFGPVLLEEARQQHPDLFRLEASLSRTFAARAVRIAPRSGRAMRVLVERLVDLENIWTALLVVEQGAETPPEALYVPGGTAVARDAFRVAATSRSRREAAALLTALVRQTPLLPAVSSEPGAERRALRALAREQRDIARLDPLGPAPIIEYVLRLRGDLQTVQQDIWGLALGATVPQLEGATRGER